MRTFQILHNVDLMLRRAEQGLLMARMGNYNLGMYDVVIHGRSVTFVLQKLKSMEPEFEAWYASYQKEMRNDEMLKFFHDLRNKMNKEGISPVHIEHSFMQQDVEKLVSHSRKRPPNTIKVVIGSNESYYEVRKDDGSIEKVPINDRMPIRFTQKFQNAPTTHLGESIEGETAFQMAERYVKYLRNVVSEAHRRFDKMKV